MVELVVEEDRLGALVRSRRDDEGAVPVEETGKDGTVDFLFQIIGATTFVVGDEAEGFSLQGVACSLSKCSMFNVGVVGEELLHWRNLLGPFF